MDLEYAERWAPVQIGVLKKFSALAAVMEAEGGCCLTKMRRDFSPSRMEDLYLSPLEPVEAAKWPGLAGTAEEMGGDGGGGVPWWGMLAIATAFAILAFAAYVLSGEGVTGRLRAGAAVFFAVAVAGSAVLIPLGAWTKPGGRGAAGAAASIGSEPAPPWPWSGDILVEQDGWSKTVHPDGRVEVLGLAGYLQHLVDRPAAAPEALIGDPVTESGDLDGEGRFGWSVRHHRSDTRQTRYLVVTDRADGEVREVEIGMKEVHAARLSPGGDRLWVAVNPGVPVNVTEVWEYAFPALTPLRSLTHDPCLREGEIVVSREGEPLLAGWFSTGPDDMESVVGLLPLLEEEAGFTGEALAIPLGRPADVDDPVLLAVANGGFRDASDGSPFLLLAGYDHGRHDVTGLTVVLDTRDGSLYEVCKGIPLGWR